MLITKQSQRAFNLVELLVTIAILGIIIALMIPAFNTIINRLDLATCSNNLRQIHSAFMLYAGDHDGDLPPRARLKNDNSGTNFTWEDIIQPYFGREVSAQYWAAGLPTLYCPAFIKASKAMGNTNHRVHNGFGTSYVCNGRLMPDISVSPTAKAVKLSRVTEPSRTLMLTDGVPFPAGPTGTVLRVSDTVPGGIGVDYSYHKDRVNALMVDGSVRQMEARPEGLDVYRNGDFLF